MPFPAPPRTAPHQAPCAAEAVPESPAPGTTRRRRCSRNLDAKAALSWGPRGWEAEAAPSGSGEPQQPAGRKRDSASADTPNGGAQRHLESPGAGRCFRGSWRLHAPSTPMGAVGGCRALGEMCFRLLWSRSVAGPRDTCVQRQGHTRQILTCFLLFPTENYRAPSPRYTCGRVERTLASEDLGASPSPALPSLLGDLGGKVVRLSKPRTAHPPASPTPGV